jgi:hypothetical protein
MFERLRLGAAGIGGIRAVERLAGLVAEKGAEQGAGRRACDPGIAVEQGGAGKAAEAGASERADGLFRAVVRARAAA